MGAVHTKWFSWLWSCRILPYPAMPFIRHHPVLESIAANPVACAKPRAVTDEQLAVAE